MSKLISRNRGYDVVMGVDMSSTSLAFSVFSQKDLQQWGKVHIDGDDNFSKCGDIIKKFSGLCGLVKPDLVVFESSTYVNNNAVMKQLSMVFGAAAGVAVNSGASVRDVPPTTWQSYIGNPANSKKQKEKFAADNPEMSDSKLKVELRKARKQRNIDFVKENYSVIIEDDDVADAVCVGHYGVNRFGGGE
jgi:Holliday junction resolvasome RuvABC endonuclease subunit